MKNTQQNHDERSRELANDKYHSWSVHAIATDIQKYKSYAK